MVLFGECGVQFGTFKIGCANYRLKEDLNNQTRLIQRGLKEKKDDLNETALSVAS